MHIDSLRIRPVHRLLRRILFGLFEPFLQLVETLLLAVHVDEFVHDLSRGHAAEPDRGIEIVERRQTVTFQNLVIVFRLHQDRQALPVPLRGLLEHLLAALDVLLAVLVLEPLPDPVLRRLRLDDRKPVAARSRLRVGRNDLDDVVGFELVIEPDHVSVDARVLTMVPDVRVDAVRKVQRRRADGQVDDLALRRQHEDVLAEEVL